LDAGDEHDAELALIDTITEPVKSHVQGLAELGHHGPIGEPNRALVIAVDNGERSEYPRSTIISRLSRAMREAVKTPAISASATKETTTGMRVECAETGWLRGASGSMAKKLMELPM
jgi:hypothetical protein